MTPYERPMFDFSASSHAAAAEAHGVAVAAGSSFTGSSEELERTCTAQDLLCLAGDAAVDLAMISQIFEASERGGEHVRMLRESSAGVARLSRRALEVHARDTGYDVSVWAERAVEETQFALLNDSDELFEGLRGGGDTVALARKVASSVMAALASAPADRMGVPGHISDALGTSVALYLIARAAESDG
jgi:hypothetical protein